MHPKIEKLLDMIKHQESATSETYEELNTIIKATHHYLKPIWIVK